MSRKFRIVRAESFRGRRFQARLEGRSRLVLDARTLRQARKIVRSVERSGDRALLEAARRLDGSKAATAAELALAPRPEDAGWTNLPEGFADALERVIEAVTDFHRLQVHPGYRLESEGVELTERRQGLGRVGVYVPGGRASYPSTAVMTVIPAQLAGVGEVVAVTPPRSYLQMPALRYTLVRLGVKEIWGVGGAQAVAALADGTETVRRVEKIVGPGNAWVTAA
ncbi:MAG: histidinol dehydrogenase, partial [Acidobacteria bacterium]|nr:histidinol dehydrogenase [Acidobacteriota bacterium]